MKQIFSLSLIFVILIAGCTDPTGNPILGDVNHFANETLPLSVAQLKPLNMSSVDNFENYKLFADSLNNLIKILNEQGDMFDIEPFNPSREGYEKASRLITEYSPLINNYNEVIYSAQAFERNPIDDNRKSFYFASGKFAFETALIVGTVFYATSYKSVGIVYRSLGLNSFAFKCPSCISVILSQAHWTIRTVLVEGSSQTAQLILDKVEDMYENGSLDKAKNSTEEFINNSRKVTQDLFSEIF